MIQMFAALVVGHALADFPLQGDFLSKAKNLSNPIPGVPWYTAMAAHCIVQGGAVWLITGNVWLGLAETVAHCAIDIAKCKNWIGFNADQVLHLACKAIWAAL